MKRLPTCLLCALCALSGCILAGCSVHEATLEGHDLLDDGLANIATGVGEYHADDAERMKQVRAKLASAFVADVVPIAGDADAVKAKTDEFVALLEAAEAAERVEEERHRKMLNTLAAMGEVNAALRDLAQIKLGWRDELRDYVNTIRRKAAGAGSP